MPGPPEAWRRLLRRITPPGERDLVDGELAELHRGRAGRDGGAAADRWYRRQVLGFLVRAPAAWLARRHERRTETEGTMSGGDGWIREIGSAVRALRRRPTFVVVAAGTLALGIGANSAVLTLVSAHFLVPLPYEDPDELVMLWETGENTDEVTTIAPGNYFTWREEARSFEDIAAYNVDAARLSGEGTAAERVPASVVAPHFFDVVGVQPVLGTTFDEASVRAADGKLAILSHGLWMRRYGGDPDVVGRDVRMDGLPHTVVGVLPPEYRQPEKSLSWQAAEVWRPMLLDGQRDEYGGRWLRAIARLADGVTPDQARAEMDAMAVRMAEAHPEENGGRRIRVFTLPDYLMGEARPVLLMLLAAAGAILLIVCANVANLMLARGRERRREFAVRAALGSGRARLMRQVAVEAVLLALLGAAVGAVGVAVAGDLLQSLQERFFTGLVEARFDLRVVALTGALALGAGLAVALPMGWSAAGTDLRGALVEGGERAGAGPGGQATRSLLIVGQVALATTLLVSAVLLTRTFNAMVDVPTGFRSRGVVSFRILAPATSYPGDADVEQYLREVERRVAEMPGVEDVGFISDLPFTTENWGTTIDPAASGLGGDEPIGVEYHVTHPGFFDALEIPRIEGADADPWLGHGDEIPVWVNEALAELLWPGEPSVVGRTFTFGRTNPTPVRVTAVVGDILDDGFTAGADPSFFLPWSARTLRGVAFLARTSGDPAALMAGIREELTRLDPDIAVGDLQTLDGLLAETVVRPRAASLIGGVFALVALLVAAAGIYGVLSYMVEGRTRELGIRAALGAGSGELMGLVLGQSTRLLAAGLLLGVGGALLTGRALGGLLFGVDGTDPLSLAVSVGVLALAGTLAAWIPARRALGVDPREALKAE